MKRFFADTGYWLALILPRDPLRNKAVALSRRIASAEVTTTQMVLTELINYATGIGLYEREQAISFVRHLQADPSVTIAPKLPTSLIMR